MLNHKQLSEDLKSERCGFSIIPEPNLSGMEDRSATSIDLRLGRWFKAFRQTHSSSFSLIPKITDQSLENRPASKDYFIPFGGSFVIHPGRFVLGVTLEWLNLPPTLSGYVTGKSSLGRHGLVIETAAGIHPGFSGCLTLELANVGEVPLEISPGMEICQVFFHRVEDGGSKPGHASGFRKPVFSERKFDPVFASLKGGG